MSHTGKGNGRQSCPEARRVAELRDSLGPHASQSSGHRGRMQRIIAGGRERGLADHAAKIIRNPGTDDDQQHQRPQAPGARIIAICYEIWRMSVM